MTPKKQDDTPRKAVAEPQNFEKALERLEKVVAEMEKGELGLEQLIERFEEGQTLLKFCSKKLNEVEKRIEVLVSKDGAVTAEPFDAEAPAPEPRGKPTGDIPF